MRNNLIYKCNTSHKCDAVKQNVKELKYNGFWYG